MKFLFRCVAALGLLSAASAPAAVRYDFAATSSFAGFTGSFSYKAPSFVASYTSVPVGNLDSCTVSNGTCGNPEFHPTSFTGFDAIVLLSGPVGSYYYFQDGAFAAPGTYSTVLFGASQFATLTVTDLGGAVPEPASWALLIGGFGLAGGAMRRRRAVRPQLA